jgi:hypothetical protein
MSLDEIVIATDSDVLVSPEPDDDVLILVDSEADTINVPSQGPPGPPGSSGSDGTDGNTILYGGSDPIATTGKDGDSYINTTTHFMFGPKSGGIWPPGFSLVGPQGPRGNTVLYGSGPPTGAVGQDGDFYVDQTNHVMYGPKAAGVWPSTGTSLVGPQGPQGVPGVPGQRGSLWYEGAGPPGTISGQQEQDNYLNVTNGDVYTLVAGAWGSPVGNIRGPMGPVGASIAYVSDTPPTGVPDNTLWWESDTGNLYLYYNDGNTKQWVIACPQPDTTSFLLKTGDTMTGSLTLAANPTAPLHAASKQYVDNVVGGVRYDTAQSLTGAQQQQARQNIFAAPYDAMQYNGLQINGNFEIAQERGSASVTITTGQATYVLDQWQIGYNSAAIASFTAQQLAFSAGGQPFGLQLNSCLYMKSGSAGTVGGGASDNCFMGCVIEGTRWSRLGYGHATAKPLTVSFWMAATRAGTYSLSFRNATPNRSYVAPFTHGGGSFWEYKQITIPGCPDGTWDKAAGVGCYIGVNLGAGSSLRAPTDNAWLTGSYMGSVAQTSAYSAANDEVYLAGFHVVPGNEGPPSDRLSFVLRPGDDELRLCMRYLQYSITGARFTATGTGQVVEDITRFAVPMRGIPTMTLIGTPPVGSSNVQAGYPQLQTPSNVAFRFLIASNAAGDCYHLYQTAKADARI